MCFMVDFSNDSMDVDSHIVEDPYADIAAVNALVSPNEKQFELFVTKVRPHFRPRTLFELFLQQM